MLYIIECETRRGLDPRRRAAMRRPIGGTHIRLTLRLAGGESIVASISADLLPPDILKQEQTFHARRSAVGVLA